MATRQSTAVKSGLMPDYTLPGMVLCRTAKFTDKEMTSGETLEMVPVPKGAKIVDINFAIDSATGVGCSEAEIGDGASQGRFFDGLSLTAVQAFALAGEGVPGSIGFQFTVDDTIDIFIGKAATGVATGNNWVMNVFYKMAGSLEDEDNLTNY